MCRFVCEYLGYHRLLLVRKMMGSMRTKVELDTAEDPEARMAMERDNARIENARDIFKNMDASNGPEARQEMAAPLGEKHLRVEVKPDFLLEGQNKAEAIRKERLKEMASMKAARERAMEDEEMFSRQNQNRDNAMKRQRELEIDMMRLARQEALEEEERLESLARSEHPRALSPGLLAARNVQSSRDFVDQNQEKVERLRLERAR